MADAVKVSVALPRPDYYMSGEYRGANNQFSKSSNYTLEVWENIDPQGIVAKDLKSESQITYTSMKGFTTDWMHLTQLLNYLP